MKTADIYMFLWLQGMRALHNSPVQVHGRLKSSNCLIDSRWICKIGDWGLSELRSPQTPEENDGMWWYCDGIVMVLWRYYDGVVMVLWRCCDSIVTVLWRCCDGIVTLLWLYCDSVVTVLWRYCDSIVTVLWRYCDGIVMVWWCVEKYDSNLDKRINDYEWVGHSELSFASASKWGLV